MGIFRRSRLAPSQKVRVEVDMIGASWLQRPTLEWGGFLSVAGESHYQEALRSHLKRGNGRRLVTAQLVPEPTNQYDPNAMRVLLAGETVGYLPRDEYDDVRDYVVRQP